MTRLLLFVCCAMTFQISSAQYYYKDILSTQQTSAQLKKYRSQAVRSIKVSSYESNGQPTEDFKGSQTIANNYSSIRTVFNTALAGESELTTYFGANGQVIKTVDTTDGSGSISEYNYDNAGKLMSIVNVSTSPGMHQEKEEHRWQYDAQGRPQTLLRIKNNIDTSVISFVLDEKGNVAEENSRRRGVAQASYYYYYDDQNRVTDIVTYNQKARRLLPIYVFEYNSEGQLASMLVVPEGTDDYQRWVYQYNDAGLKTRETAFNKKKQMLGRIEYSYSE